MTLTSENYYSRSANLAYFSVSQFKSFLDCEAAAMAELKGEYTPQKGRALLLGSYVDEMLTGTPESQREFIIENESDLFKKNGDLYADVMQAAETVERIRAQPLMMKYLDGEHQTIMTGEIEGVPFKGKFDCYRPGKFIADLKYLKDFRSPNLFENAISYYGYITQGAVYRELVKQNTGDILPFYLVIATKQEPADLAVVEVSDYDLNEALDALKKRIVRFQNIKTGSVKPERCESHDCPFCRGTKILTDIIDSSLLGMSRKQLKAMRGDI